MDLALLVYSPRGVVSPLYGAAPRVGRNSRREQQPSKDSRARETLRGVDKQLRELDLKARFRALDKRDTLVNVNPDEVVPRRERKRLAAATKAERKAQKSRGNLEKARTRANQQLRSRAEEPCTAQTVSQRCPTPSTEPSLFDPNPLSFDG